MYKVNVNKYFDKNNPVDTLNGKYYISIYDEENDDSYVSEMISNKFKINFLDLVRKHNGYSDKDDYCFKYKKDANECAKELRNNITGGIHI